MAFRQWFLAISLVVLPAGCSPYNYGKEIAEFSKDVDQVVDAYKSGYSSLAADRAAQTRRLRILDRAYLMLSETCDTPVTDLEESQQACTLVQVNHRPPVARRPLPVNQDSANEKATRKRLAVAASVLQDYVHGLAAVTNAEDRAAFDKSVAALSDAVDGFAQFAPGIGQLAPVAINLFGWMVGTALDQQRFDALKEAVNKVGKPTPSGVKPINAVQEALSAGLTRLNRQRRDVILQEADILVRGLGPQMSEEAYRQRLAEVEGLVSVLEGLRRADPQRTGKELEKAHDALVLAVNNPKTQYPAMLKALGEFKDKATALKSAIGATPSAKKGD